MGMLDRMRDKGRTQGTPLALESGIQAPEVDAPVYQRMQTVVEYITTMMPDDFKGAKIAKRVGRELVTDMAEIPPVFVEFYTKQLTAMMYWVATGEKMEDMPLPADFGDSVM